MVAASEVLVLSARHSFVVLITLWPVQTDPPASPLLPFACCNLLCLPLYPFRIVVIFPLSTANVTLCSSCEAPRVFVEEASIQVTTMGCQVMERFFK